MKLLKLLKLLPIYFTYSVIVLAQVVAPTPPARLYVTVFPGDSTASITNYIGVQPSITGGTTILSWADMDTNGTPAGYNWDSADAAIELWSGMGKYAVNSIATSGGSTIFTLSRPPSPAAVGQVATIAYGVGTGTNCNSNTQSIGVQFSGGVISAVSGSTVTVPVNTSGCVYTTKSATLTYSSVGGFSKHTNFILWGMGDTGQLPPNYVANVNGTSVISAIAVASNPTTFTLATAVSPLPTVGTAITISGVTGAGCSPGLNGDLTITAVTSNSLTVAVDSTGCTYTANSGTLTYNTNGYQQVTCSAGTLPVYYNSVYKNAYKTFITAFLHRYGSNANVDYIRIGLGKGGGASATCATQMKALPDCASYVGGSGACTTSQFNLLWENYIGEMTSFETSKGATNQLMTNVDALPAQFNVMTYEANNATKLGIGFGTNGMAQADYTNHPTKIATVTTPTSGGVVSGCTIVDGGVGYPVTPILSITGTGTGAAGTLGLTGGVVTSCTITTPGTSYTNANARVLQSPGSCAADWCYQAQNLQYSAKRVPFALQAATQSDPTNVSTTGTLTTLIPLGISLGASIFEIMINDARVAYDPTYLPLYSTNPCNGVAITCGQAYRNLFTATVPPLDTTTSPKVDFYKYFTYGPQTMIVGRTHIFHIGPEWGIPVSCDHVTNNCYNPTFNPTISDEFRLSTYYPPPGGIQNKVYQLGIPTYRAINGGTLGNVSGHWNIAKPSALTTSLTITSDTSTVFHTNKGTYVNANPIWLLETTPNALPGHFDGFPAGTTFKYWHPNTAIQCYLGPTLSVPASGPFLWGNAGAYQCVEVTIPVDAVPGTYQAGWTFCRDSIGTDCGTVSWPIDVIQLPTYTKVAPTTVLPLPVQFTDPAALCMDSNFNPTAGTNCSFANLAIAGAGDSPRGGADWCPDTHNPDNFMEVPSYNPISCFAGTPGYCTTPSTNILKVGNGILLGSLFLPQHYYFITDIGTDAPNSFRVSLTQGGTPIALGSSGTSNIAGAFMQMSQEGLTTPASDWYYDGARNFYNIANWFGLPQWENCARMVSSRYNQIGPGSTTSGSYQGVGSNQVLAGPYNTLGTAYSINNWRHFADGTSIGMARFNRGVYSDTFVPNTSNAQMISAIKNLWRNNFASNIGPGGNPGTEREHAYAVNIMVHMRELLGLSTTDGSQFALSYKRTIDALATIVLMYLNPPANQRYDMGPIDIQTWMLDGLIVEALIHEYEQSKDPRDLYLIKRLLDITYANYDYVAHAATWMRVSYGPYCFDQVNDPNISWYSTGGNGNCGYAAHPELNMMLAANYAWWWKNYGGSDNTYQIFADELYTYGMSTGFFRPKDFNQVFWFAFDYVRRRQGR